MPNANRILGPWIPSGDPDVFNQATLDRPGELGGVYEYNDRVYQLVKVDSGCVAATTVELNGVVAANQLAFWKLQGVYSTTSGKNEYLVTNDKRFSIGGSLTYAGCNSVAGIFREAATAGRYTWILKKGPKINVISDSGDAAAADMAIADTTALKARVTHSNAGTAPITQIVGAIRSGTSTTPHVVDVDINDVP